MTRLDVILIAVAGLALLPGNAGAQSANAPSSIYTPKTQPQPQPLRVEVIDGTRFRDIETRTVYRLYGIEACAPDQTARLGRQPWPCGAMAVAWLVTATLNRWLACGSVRVEGDEQLVRCATAGHADLAADCHPLSPPPLSAEQRRLRVGPPPPVSEESQRRRPPVPAHVDRVLVCLCRTCHWRYVSVYLQ